MPRKTYRIDPAVAHERARKAAQARTTADAHIRALVEQAPTFSPSQRRLLAELFRLAIEDACSREEASEA